MLRNLAFIALSLAILAVAYFLISDITRKDIIAANAFTRQIQTEPLKAGDVVVASSDGRMSRICDAVLEEDGLTLERRSERYFNRAQRIMSSTVGWAVSVGLLDEPEAQDALRTSIPFVGNASSLALPQPEYANPTSCECAIARSLSRGEKVCQVNASLIETSEVVALDNGQITTRPVERAIAVTLKRHVFYIPRQTFENCNVEYSDKAKLAEQMLCAGDEKMPFDVKLRQVLNLIDSEPFLVSTQ